MNDIKYDHLIDKDLNVSTTGLIDWPNGAYMDYNRTESSSYADLDHLIAEYKGIENSHLVDFGSGKGRILFYFNHKLGIPTTGIEVNRIAYSYLVQNYVDYTAKFPKRAQDIRYHEIKAEEYPVKAEDNVFYFFNPFTVKIFDQVMKNIETSLLIRPRPVDIILFYPEINVTEYLEQQTSFKKVQTIKNKHYQRDNRECFYVYRYMPE